MKSLTIDALLSWAFVHELPKGGGIDGLANMNSAWRMIEASSWGKIMSFAELMTTIDQGRRDFENVFIEQGEPHPDAVVVGDAVAALASAEIEIDGAGLLADWPRTDPAYARLTDRAVDEVVAGWRARTRARRAASAVSLVVSRAVLGRAPDWEAEPRRMMIVERGGKPAWFVIRRVKDELGNVHMLEVDGYNSRSGRPVRGAYRKYCFSHEPDADILGRIDWQIWVAALGFIESRVADGLSAHRLVPCSHWVSPWLAEDLGGVRITALERRPGQAAHAA